MTGESQTTYSLGKSLFRVSYLDIIHSRAQALVSSDDNYLTMGGGVSMSIASAGGSEISRHARKLTPLRQGDVAVTTAGALPAKYIFHAVTIDLDKRQNPNAGCVETLVSRCFELAALLGIRTIAFPALGTGAGGFPFQEGADVMVRTIADRLADEVPVEEVDLTLWARPGVSRSDLNIFYERTAALASVAGQSRRLADAVKTLEEVVDETDQPRLRAAIHDLLSMMRNSTDALQERPRGLADVDRIEEESTIADTSRRVVELTQTDDGSTLWKDQNAAAAALQTRLEGLNTLLNVHYGSLNKLEIEKARYGGVGVPLILENQISEVAAEIERVDKSIQETRRKSAKLAAERETPH
jgi:O-acetyl-ADP-ribose deacetylase (regulator of RNase III)